MRRSVQILLSSTPLGLRRRVQILLSSISLGLRRSVLILVPLALLAGCLDDRVTLRRGPLGPARYRVDLSVEGAEPSRERVFGRLEVSALPSGARLRLEVPGAPSVSTDVRRTDGGQLVLESVEGIPPPSAGEADLASLVAQLDPPLPAAPVRLREGWSQTRRIHTGSMQAELTSRLQVTRFRRIAGLDAAELAGSVSGRLSTSGVSGLLSGDVRGRTVIAWALAEGRVAASETRLEWSVRGVGTLVVTTIVRPD